MHIEYIQNVSSARCVIISVLLLVLLCVLSSYFKVLKYRQKTNTQVQHKLVKVNDAIHKLQLQVINILNTVEGIMRSPLGGVDVKQQVQT